MTADDLARVKQAFVDAAISDPAHPVVMFALEWCEFCWSVRKLFGALGIPYRAIDLDAVAYQADDLGGRVRAVLARRTGAATIPRIFVAGRHLGGCTDAFDAYRTGELQSALRAAGVPFDATARLDIALGDAVADPARRARYEGNLTVELHE
jgi:cysteine synthase A